MFVQSLLVLLVASSVFSTEQKGETVSNRDENELITVDLKRKNGSEEIKLMVQLRIHLIRGQVHLNGKSLEHGIVHSVHMKVTLIEIEKGIKKPARLATVHVRVLVSENVAKKILVVEEEFVSVEDHEVIQILVKQVIWESLVRKPVTVITLTESKIHGCPREKDHHMFYNYHPKLPKHGYGYEGDDDNDKLDESDGHHHGYNKIKCWYHHLSLKSKICLFSVGFLGLLTLVICCSVCVKKRQNHRQTLQIAAPIDDTVVVKEKKADTLDGEKYNFHFQFDNTVVVDDKKNLIE